MARNLKNIIKRNIVATNTLYNPQNNDIDSLVTWISNTNNVKKQHAYITISHKHKNCAKTQERKEMPI